MGHSSRAGKGHWWVLGEGHYPDIFQLFRYLWMKEDLGQDLLITKWSTAILLVQATVFSRLHYTNSLPSQ